MNTKYLSNGIVVGFVLPLFLLAAGCKDEHNSTADTTTGASAGDTNATTLNADNSGKNQRDRGDMTLLPGDQGTTDADRQATRKIRQTLVSGTTDYSMTAKNVKIITANGKVTLRGPVNSDAEKTGIEAIAKNIAGDGNVDDQLEVKTNP
jgi:osmotically-inducible protein OsmY